MGDGIEGEKVGKRRKYNKLNGNGNAGKNGTHSPPKIASPYIYSALELFLHVMN